jgi:hypothetical protein
MDTSGSQVYCKDMGLFGGKTKTTALPEPITFDEAIVHMGLPPRTIIREQDVTWELWCSKTDLPGRGEPAHCYPATIINLGKTVAVRVGNKTVAHLSDSSLSEAVDALRQYGGKSAPAVLVLGGDHRRTERVMVPKK